MRRFVITVAVFAIVAAACGDSRPDRDAWQVDWERVSQAIPNVTAFVGGPDEELCADALVLLRAANDDLLPTPDSSLDDAVRAWLAQARETFLECPPRGAAEGFEAAYDRLDTLRAEVDAGLARTN